MLTSYIIISINKSLNNPSSYDYYVEDKNGSNHSLSKVSKEAFENYEEFLLEQLDFIKQIKSQGN